MSDLSDESQLVALGLVELHVQGRHLDAAALATTLDPEG